MDAGAVTGGSTILEFSNPTSSVAPYTTDTTGTLGLSVTPATSAIPANSFFDLTLNFNTSGLAAGTYFGSFKFTTNGTATIVPVTLQVQTITPRSLALDPADSQRPSQRRNSRQACAPGRGIIFQLHLRSVRRLGVLHRLHRPGIGGFRAGGFGSAHRNGPHRLGHHGNNHSKSSRRQRRARMQSILARHCARFPRPVFPGSGASAGSHPRTGHRRLRPATHLRHGHRERRN